MANVKITELTADTNPASTDVLPFVDISADTTKKVTIADLLENAGSGTASAPGFGFDSDPGLGMYRTGNDALAFTTGGTGRLFIDNSGNVGIGATTVDEKLHLESSNATVRVKVESTAANSYPGVRLTNDVKIYDLQIDGATDGFRVYDGSASTERFRVSSAGNLGIGTTTPPRALTNANSVTLTTGTAPQYRLNATAADGADNDRAVFGLATSNSHFVSTAVPGDAVLRTTNGGNLLFGEGTTETMRITSAGQMRLAGAGITFNGDTATENELDDYEEGTWTPAFIGTSTAGTPTYGTNGQAGKYTKVGNKVTAWAFIHVTALGGAAGNINITGLPFAIDNTGFGASGISVGHADGTLGNSVRAYHNTTFLELRNNNSVVTAATGQIYVSISYTN